ncbi:hypothetical protein Y1Q_0010875 [Alligator mississippiensis]|uniref:Uncharacterized protein n=1 Tax=Alligator mississippiensis TaxID=8496 RepID=A0A151M775_ALLMI|nr:hypothetical protein Y1Q_0010875 [Alligator mississippiensis]
MTSSSFLLLWKLLGSRPYNSHNVFHSNMGSKSSMRITSYTALNSSDYISDIKLIWDSLIQKQLSFATSFLLVPWIFQESW